MKELILPRYLNLVDMECEDPENFDKIEFNLSLNKWYSIPTSFDEIIGDGGTICDVPVIPSKNIQIEILYNGGLNPLDRKDFSSIGIVQNYPCENPILNSEFLKVISPNYYQFTTQYSTQGFKFPSLSQAIALTAKQNDIEERKKEVSIDVLKELITGNDLENTLRRLYQFVENTTNENEREDGQHDNFSAIYQEFVNTKSISGDCKSISTFTAGLLNSLGLRSRCLEAIVHSKESFKVKSFGKEKEVNGWGHQFAEVYIPVGNMKGVWMPVDPSLGYLFEFPSSDDLYIFKTDLPKFDNSNKTAQIRIKYI